MTDFKPSRLFAWMFGKFGPQIDEAGFDRFRGALVEGIEGRVLEVGAGTGLNLSRYHRAAEIVALEPNHHMHKHLREAAEKTPIKVTISSSTAYPLPFDSASFDAVVFSLVLCSIKNQARALEEAKRVLKPGGRVYVLEHVAADDPKLARWQNRVQPLWGLVAGGCHLNRHTLSAIKDAGFRVDEVENFDFDTGSFSVLARPHIRGSATKVE